MWVSDFMLVTLTSIKKNILIFENSVCSNLIAGNYVPQLISKFDVFSIC